MKKIFRTLAAVATFALAGAAVAQPAAIYTRSTSGGGSVDTSGLDSGFCNTQGSILHRTSTVWLCLGVGSAGDLLKSGGAGANAAWYTPPTVVGTPAAGCETYWTSATAQALFCPTSTLQLNQSGSSPTNYAGSTVTAGQVPTAISSAGVLSGTATPTLGASGTLGTLTMGNATSGLVTVTPPAGALGTFNVTLPNAASTLPIFGQQVTFAGPTAARTITLPDAAFTAARTDAANTFTGIQTFSSPPVVAGTTAADQAAAAKVGEYQEVNCGIPAASGASLAFTNASPTVGTWTTHPFQQTNVGFSNSYACPFTITANAPTGLSTATNYWAVPIDANTFHVSTSAANAAAGTFANTSSSTATANLTNSIALTTTAGLAPVMLKLTAGDWDCQGSAIRVLGATTSVTNMQTGINSSSTAIGGLGTYFDFETAANIMTATNNPVHTTPTVRLNLSSTTAEYLVALDTFTASTNTTSGFLRCRRTR